MTGHHVASKRWLSDHPMMPPQVTEEQNPRPLTCKGKATHNPEAVLLLIHGAIKFF